MSRRPAWEEHQREKVVDRFFIEKYKSEFFPDGVIQLKRLTRGPTIRESEFYYQSVKIKNPEELNRVKAYLDFFAAQHNWQELPPLLEEIVEQLRQGRIDPEVENLVRQYPEASISMLRAFDNVFQGNLNEEDLPLLESFIETATDTLQNRQRDFIEIQLDLLNRLSSEESVNGIQRLLRLLGQYSLPQLTSIATILTDRLQRLQIFEAQIQNENAYEIRGENSIHNQLLKSLWILDDSYWLLHSNEPLYNFLGQEITNSSPEERQRPDFVCANDTNRLIIVEIKRPSHQVQQRDINQLQNYLATVDSFQQFPEKRGYLVARSISDRYRTIVDDIRSIEFISYAQLVDNCNRRYREYIQAIERDG